MEKGQRLWTNEELLLAINLYCKLPFGKMHKSNPSVINLANLIGRTPSSIALKLVNLASFDPSLQARGIKGASHAGKLDREIWDEFFQGDGRVSYESEKILASLRHTSVERLNDITEDELPKEGKTREQIVMTRVNQSLFRKLILASYNSTCCITGIQQTQLLVASHIRPWSLDKRNRLNAQNGIAINALHDKAFENGLITITVDYKVKVSPILLKQKNSDSIIEYFIKYHDKNIILPSRSLPDKEFLKYHNNERFKA